MRFGGDDVVVVQHRRIVQSEIVRNYGEEAIRGVEKQSRSVGRRLGDHFLPEENSRLRHLYNLICILWYEVISARIQLESRLSSS